MVADLRLAKEVRATHFLVRIDSQLIVNQVKGDYQTKDPLFLKY